MKLNNKGFSLAETLIAILISSFITLIVGAGMITSIRCYREISMKSQAQSMLSTYMSEFQETLSNADMSKKIINVTSGQGNSFSNVFYSKSYNSYGTYILVEYENGTHAIVFQPLVNNGHYWIEMDKQYIMNAKNSVSNSFSAADISVAFNGFKYNELKHCFEGNIEMYVNSESFADSLCETEFAIYPTDYLLSAGE